MFIVTEGGLFRSGCVPYVDNRMESDGSLSESPVPADPGNGVRADKTVSGKNRDDIAIFPGHGSLSDFGYYPALRFDVLSLN